MAQMRLPGLAMLAGSLALGYGPSQHDGWIIAGLYLWLFAWYGFILMKSRDEHYPSLRLLAILMRFSLIAALPNLSDDVYRFIWDGRLIWQGINPFDHMPRHYQELDPALFSQLNSPDYYTVYPPLAQLSFTAAVGLFPQSILGAAVVLKIIHAALDTGAILLLERLAPRFGLPRKAALIYALNPLIIIELTGNLHFEAAMVFFLALALWLMSRNQWSRAAWAWAGAISAKLLPLLFLPFLIRRLGWPRLLSWSLLLGAALLLLFAPLLNGLFFGNIGTSLNLYFQKFEFNASVYYLLRWLGFQIKGYNLIQTIGPVLAMLVLSTVLALAWREKGRSVERLPEMWLFAITIYLALSPVVHPWYLALPVFFSALSRYRYPLLWSALAPLSYLAYRQTPVEEAAWVLWIQYGAVFPYALWEIFFRRDH